MAKRLIRIEHEKIEHALPSLTGIEADFILNNKSVIHGRLKKVHRERLEIRDFKNIKHIIDLRELHEIIRDFVE
jgi:hypothetical protein